MGRPSGRPRSVPGRIVTTNGELNNTDGGYEARFERALDRPIEKVWDALSEQEHLEAWLGVVESEGEPDGGFVTEHGEGEIAEDRILRIEPPHLLEHTR